MIGLGLAGIAGAFMALIHPPFSILFGILAIPALDWIYAKWSRPYGIGYAFGVGYFLVSMHWIMEPFAVQSEYIMLAPLAWLAMGFGLALFWMPLFRLRHLGILSVPVIFTMMEWVRGHILTGLPWNMLAYGFVDTRIALDAAFVGSYLLSGFLFLTAILIGGRTNTRTRLVGIGILGVLLILPEMRSVPAVQDFADYRVTLVQANHTQQDTYTRDPRMLLDETIALGLAAEPGDLIILPEGGIPFSPDLEPALIPYLDQALGGKDILFGAGHIENDEYYNSAFLLQKATITHRYDKIHLVPFGEYIPFGDLLRAMGIKNTTLTRYNVRKGTYRPMPDQLAPKINILICYEGIFPSYAQREGAFTAILTNDSWFGKNQGPRQHFIAARMRAIETGKPVARVARTGISALIDAKGQVVAALDIDEKGAITQRIGPQFRHGYHIWLEHMVIFGIFIYLVLIVLKSHKKITPSRKILGIDR